MEHVCVVEVFVHVKQERVSGGCNTRLILSVRQGLTEMVDMLIAGLVCLEKMALSFSLMRVRMPLSVTRKDWCSLSIDTT